MDREPTNRRLLMRLVVGGLIAWGLFLGIGSYLGLDPETPDRDIRRMLIITGSVGIFLAVWMAALWIRSRR
jgi:membrane protein DedA with SNARE-associated domain